MFSFCLTSDTIDFVFVFFLKNNGPFFFVSLYLIPPHRSFRILKHSKQLKATHTSREFNEIYRIFWVGVCVYVSSMCVCVCVVYYFVVFFLSSWISKDSYNCYVMEINTVRPLRFIYVNCWRVKFSAFCPFIQCTVNVSSWWNCIQSDIRILHVYCCRYWKVQLYLDEYKKLYELFIIGQNTNNQIHLWRHCVRSNNSNERKRER